jgi:hypothetical protein
LTHPTSTETISQQDCENASSRQADQSVESENSSIDSVPSSAPSSPVNSVAVEISSPDESMHTMCPMRLQKGIWDLTPAFSPMKEACTEENISYAKHLSFKNIKGAIADASNLMDSSAGSMSPHFMPSLCI